MDSGGGGGEGRVQATNSKHYKVCHYSLPLGYDLNLSNNINIRMKFHIGGGCVTYIF